MSGVGGTYPDSSTGKAIGFFVVFFGITIFAIFYCQNNFFYNFYKLKYVINNPKDLKNKRVGTKKDTTSLDELNKLGPRSFQKRK
jgi:ABC-type amino acid transport substrate-binding protein